MGNSLFISLSPKMALALDVEKNFSEQLSELAMMDFFCVLHGIYVCMKYRCCIIMHVCVLCMCVLLSQ